MSKYYRAEDVQELIIACTWRMTLAKERNGEGFVEYDKKVLDVDELRKRLSTLPTVDIVECDECLHKLVCLKVEKNIDGALTMLNGCSLGERTGE